MTTPTRRPGLWDLDTCGDGDGDRDVLEGSVGLEDHGDHRRLAQRQVVDRRGVARQHFSNFIVDHGVDAHEKTLVPGHRGLLAGGVAQPGLVVGRSAGQQL